MQPWMNCARRSLLLALLPVLLGACATKLQARFDQAMRIEASCTAIQEAVPVRQNQAREAMFDTVALRLVGTCLEGGQGCLSLPGGADKDEVSSALGGLHGTLDKHKLLLEAAAQDAGNDLKAELGGVLADYAKARAAFLERQGAVTVALEGVRIALRKARDTVQQASSADVPAAPPSCKLRSDCVLELARTLRQEEGAVYRAIGDLEAALRAMGGAGRDAMAVLDRAAQLKPASQQAAERMRQSLADAATGLRRDAQLLDQAVQGLATRLEHGRQALGRLLSGDVQSAAADFLMAKASSKAAERTLVLIDGLLSGIDRTIDKMDDRLLGSATLASELFSEDIQEQFDRIFTEVIGKYYTNPTAKLAFASAACERLGMGNGPAVKNSSMFSPFLHATLINIGFELTEREKAGNRKAELARMRAESFDDAIQRMPALTAGVARAYDNAILAKEMPPLQQQVAKCAYIEQQLAADRTLSAGQARVSSARVCANEIAAATVAQTQFSDISRASAVRAIDADLPPPAGPPGPAGPADGDARALSAALDGIATALKPVAGKFDALCKRIELRVKGARCDSAGSRAVVEFDAGFAAGQARDRTLELSLADLSQVVNTQPAAYVLLIQGYASRKLPLCRGKMPPDERRRCGIRENEQLAYQRANWAKAILLLRMAPRHRAESDTGKPVEPLSFDAAGDRRIRITFEESPT